MHIARKTGKQMHKLQQQSDMNYYVTLAVKMHKFVSKTKFCLKTFEERAD